MSENPNFEPQNQSPHLTQEEKAVFTLDNADEWRNNERVKMATALADANDGLDSSWWQHFEDGVEVRLDAYLQSKGLDSTSPNYSSICQAFRNISIDRVKEWQLSESDDELTPRESFQNLISSYETSADADDTLGHDSDMNEERTLDTIREELGIAREKWAKISAKVQGRAANYKKIHGHNAARDEYQALVRELGIQELSVELADTDDQQVKDTRVLEYLFEEQHLLREATTAELKGTKVGRFVHFMNKGGLGKRLIKGVGVGLVVGTGGGLLLGAAGAGVAAAGAVMASRFIKGYASNDKYRGMMTAEEALKDEGELNTTFDDTDGVTLEERVDAAVTESSDIYEIDTKREQAKRRKAFIWGAGSVAIGSALGYSLSNSDVLHEVKSTVQDKLFGSSDVKTQPGGLTSPDTKLTLPDVDTHDGPSYDIDNLSHDAMWVHSGEGWYETFDDMGIPVAERAQLLREIGPELQQQGWAYRMPNGEWGISQPGKLPDDVLQLIQDNRR